MSDARFTLLADEVATLAAWWNRNLMTMGIPH